MANKYIFDRLSYVRLDSFVYWLFRGSVILYDTLKADYHEGDINQGFAKLSSEQDEDWRMYSSTVPVVMMTPDRWVYYKEHNSLIDSSVKQAKLPIIAIKSEGSTEYTDNFPTHEDARIYLSGSQYRLRNRSNWMISDLIFGADFDDEKTTQITDFSNNNYNLNILGTVSYENRVSGSISVFDSASYAYLSSSVFLPNTSSTISLATIIYNSSSIIGDVIKYGSGTYGYGIRKDTSSSFEVWMQKGADLYSVSQSIPLSNIYYCLGMKADFSSSIINSHLDGEFQASSSTSGSGGTDFGYSKFSIAECSSSQLKIDDVWLFNRELSNLEWENVSRLGHEQYEKILWYNSQTYSDENDVPEGSGSYYYKVYGYQYPYYYPARTVKNSYTIIARTDEIAEANQIKEAIDAIFYNSNIKNYKWSGSYFQVELTDLGREIMVELGSDVREHEVRAGIVVTTKMLPRIMIERSTKLLDSVYSVGTTITETFVKNPNGYIKVK